MDNKYQLATISTDPEVLDRLSEDEEYKVKWHVANNHNTSSKTLSKLATDRISGIRARVADNKNTDITTLIQLTKDHMHNVSDLAKENLKNRDVLGDLLGESKCYESFQEWASASRVK